VKIRWSGCLVSVLGLLLLVPLFPSALTLFAFQIFNDTGSSETTAVVDHGLLLVKLGLWLAALLFFGGLFWMCSGREPELPLAEPEQPDAEDRR